jgi:hypothetical protein
MEGIGIFRFLFLTGLAVFLFYIVFKQLGIDSNHYLITTGFVLLIMSVHIQRADKEFLRIIETHPLKIYYPEYLLLSLPLLTGLVWYGLWSDILIILGSILATGFINYTPRLNNRNDKLLRLIPGKSFEWKSGIRKNYIIIIFILTAGIAGNFFFTASVPVTMIILCLLVVNFYQTGEPETFIILYEKGAKRFLFGKTGELIMQFTLAVVPALILFILFYPEFWFVPAIELILIYFVFIYTVFLKYAFYTPNEKLVANQTLSAIGVMSLLLPFMLPVTIILSVRFYYKSLSNLEPYLYDFD